MVREQKRMLDEEVSFTSDGVLSQAEQQHLEGHSSRIHATMAKILPRLPLDWVSVLVRSGAAIILFLLLVAPPYTYLRAQYLAPVMTTASSASGTASVLEYIPEVPVSVASSLWMRRDTGGPDELTSASAPSGMAAGIVPQTLDGAQGEAAFWTESRDGKRVLVKLATDEYFRAEKTTSSTFWDDHDFASAVAVASGTDVLVAAAYRDGHNGKVALQTFDGDGHATTKRIDMNLDAGESVDDLQALPWGNAWALVTSKPRGPDVPLFDPSHVVVRLFDRSLAQTGSLELAESGYELGAFPIVVPDPAGDGYQLIVTGHPSVRTQDEIGDRLFAFQYNADKKLYRVLRLTNTGGQKDFDTTGYAMTADGDYVIGVQNLPAPLQDGSTSTYPDASGRSYLRFFDPSLQIAGAVIVYDDPMPPGAVDRRGVSHLRQSLIGNRMYMLYDQLEQNGPLEPSRSVQAMWASISR
jgi:hypothetical protein